MTPLLFARVLEPLQEGNANPDKILVMTETQKPGIIFGKHWKQNVFESNQRTLSQVIEMCNTTGYPFKAGSWVNRGEVLEINANDAPINVNIRGLNN